MRLILILIAGIYALNGANMLVMPKFWFDAVPGVSMLGPYNTHFIRDVGLLYLVTAGAFWWASARPGRMAGLLVAAAWPTVHAVYHLQMWIARGLPFDLIAWVNILVIQAPAWAGIYCAYRLYKQSLSTSG
ncbi:MAG: hypothetical protein HKN14_10845 [Marinicaulis sp.]|nr:hypothetical protein [Marinicaulis sp.]NNE41398.1 hypothetical protein [Marinicaulis sp.]NNL89434.1 hypothetical protein [Marinicaulis sp.]